MSIKERIKNYFGKGKTEIKWNNVPGIEWDWENFHSTKDFPVSDKLLDWVIGQDQAMKECYLCLDEWIHKLKFLQSENWWKDWETPEASKPAIKKKLSPGPYLLLLGDPGTGKSLIGRALAEKLSSLYQEHNIKLNDVVCWKNNVLPSEPRISIHPAGKGKEIIYTATHKIQKKSWLQRWGFRIFMGFIGGLGLLLLGIAFFVVIQLMLIGIPFYAAMASVSQLLVAGGGLALSTFMLYFFSKMWGTIGGNNNVRGIGGATRSDAPKLLINNSQGIAQFIDATGHGSSQLFGSIAWDPYQTGGLGTPEHQRVSAGDVHRANLGILYIDELKNLHVEEAITLLTVLEEGQLPITLRSQFHGGDTAAMSISTESVPCVTFLVGAGNFDSIGKIHPALMDRIYGYGKVVRMNNDMPNTIENRRKYIQFISQEIKRFNLLPFTREACIEVIDEARRRSDKRDSLICKFRPLISIIKTASVLAMNEGKEEVSADHVKCAINEHCKTIQRQLLEHMIEEENKFLIIEPKGKKPGIIYGLAVSEDRYSGEMIGSVMRLKAQMVKTKGKNKGSFHVTGISKDALYMPGSIAKVRSVILKKYGVDISSDFNTHIDYSQTYSVDGPSAGVTMTLALCSLLENKQIRQDVAVTGEINISSDDEIEITAVGGLYEKIKAAEKWGFKEVIIPEKNYLHSIDPTDFKIKVIPGRTLDDYLKVLLV
jgi:Lon-like ATP-dependent protease